jgi:predicted DNA-binding transcriptional regulator YafY
LFHPTQTTEREAVGALIVRFRAGGVQEMCWHLFTSGTAVTVIGPESLRVVMANMTTAAAQHNNTLSGIIE